MPERPLQQSSPPDAPADQQPRAVYIAGNGHSGSTLLELLLVNGADTVGVGEFASIVWNLRKRNQPFDEVAAKRCQCGRPASDCELWGPLLPELRRLVDTRRDPQELLGDAYGLLWRHIQERWPGSTLIDSSKNERNIAHLSRAVDGDLTVLHLVRDVRSWSVSTRRRARKVEPHGLPAVLRSPTKRSIGRWYRFTHLQRFRRWHERNRRIEAAIDASGVRTLLVSYEELAVNPSVLTTLFDRLHLEAASGEIRPGAGRSHAIEGNDAMRLSPTRSAGVVYSTAWMTDGGWVLPSMLLRSTMRYNATRVHGGVLARNPTDHVVPLDELPAR